MRNDEKLDVMVSGDALDIGRPARKAPATPVTPLTARAPYRRAPATAAWTPSSSAGTAPAPTPATMRYALLLPLTWLCGPAALLLTPAGRRDRAWLALGLVAVAAAALLIVLPFERLLSLAGAVAPLTWATLAVLATAGGFAAWARAVQIAAAALPPPHKLPRWWRSRLFVGALGLLAPGCGQLATGSRRRAALCLWLLWPAALGAAVLANAAAMWRHLLAVTSSSLVADALELAFVAAAAAVVAGIVFWLAQALDGARRLAPAPALGRARGDGFAVALGVACIALAVAGQPARVARQLGEAALILRAEGLSVIPLRLCLAADRLDPSQAAYAVQAIALYESRGQSAAAVALRARLDEGLAPYVALREFPAARPDGGATGPRPASEAGRARDAAAAGGDIYYGTLAKPRRPAAR